MRSNINRAKQTKSKGDKSSKNSSINAARNSELFEGMTDKEFNSTLQSINSGIKLYDKNEIIFSAGDFTDKIGLILEGSVVIENSDIWGNNTILGIAEVNEFFAETYALLNEPLLVDVRANEKSKILFLRVNDLNPSASWSFKLIQNLLKITARKNLHLLERSFINANKTIRRKVMSYLNSLALKSRSQDLCIPLNRQQMADYLNTDRSALSKELCSMRNEGIIQFHKNHFVINITCYIYF